jgi:hypothetical protein
MNYRVVGGLFPDLVSAKAAVKELKGAGFAEEDIGLAMRAPAEWAEQAPKEASGTRAAEEATEGAVSGGLLGGLAGYLAAAGIVGVPGIGPLLAAGLLAVIATGAGVGAAAGGLVGALVGSGIPNTEAEYWSAHIEQGQVLVTVKTRDRVADARHILQRHHAETEIGPEPKEQAGTIII